MFAQTAFTENRKKGKKMQENSIRQTEKQNNKKYALTAFLAIIIFVIIYKYSLNELPEDELTDLVSHTRYAQDIYLDRLWNSWLHIPYLFWHLCVKSCIKFLEMPVIEAAAFTCAVFAAGTCYVTFYLLDRTASRLVNRDAGMVAACAAGMLGLVQPMYVYWFNAYQYEGQFSINPIFNPTHMAVKPFGLLCFMLAIDLIRCYKGEDALYFPGIRSPKWLYPLFSAALLLSAFTKPTFMYMLLPAGAVYLLFELFFNIRSKEKDFKKLWGFTWRMLLASAPSLLYLGFEYAAFYLWGGTSEDARVTIYPFLTAWRLYSPNIPRSLRLSMAFPFWMVLTNWKYFLRSVEGRLSIIGYVVGTLEFSFFVEEGIRLSHLNFAWPMLSGMLLLWVISAACLVSLTISEKTGKWNRIVVSVGWLLLSVHLFSGLYYINPFMYII